MDFCSLKLTYHALMNTDSQQLSDIVWIAVSSRTLKRWTEPGIVASWQAVSWPRLTECRRHSRYCPEWVSGVAQSCPTLCDPVDCSPPISSVHGILQARILECVAISFSRGSSRPRDQTQVSHIAGRRFNLWAIREAPRPMQVSHCVDWEQYRYLFSLK